MLALPLVVFAAIAIAAAPAPFALQDAPDAPIDDGEDDPCDNLVSVTGEVTELLYKPYDDPEDDEDDGMIVTSFVIDDETAVSFGPWWYWVYIGFDMEEFLEVGDEVEVTGEWEEQDDGTLVLCAWHIVNLTADEELTIKEEGRPPWAGGPTALSIDP